MQLRDKEAQDHALRSLQNQVNELTATRLLLEEEVAQLKAQLAQKEHLDAMIAHELRSPLTPIINYAQLIARPNQKRESIERNGQIIVGQSWRLARLVKDWLDVSRLSRRQFTLKHQTCNLGNIVKQLVEQIKPVAPFHTFEVKLPAQPLLGHWDGERLQQALGNLLDHAIKFSEEGTTITVHAWQEQQSAHVSIHNVEMSIPQAQTEQLHHPLADLRDTELQDSSGLGLFITRTILQAHEGELRLDKLPDGQGTTLSFTLPL